MFLTFALISGCVATKGTLNVRDVHWHVRSDAGKQIKKGESFVFGRIMLTLNGKNKNPVFGDVTVTDLSGEKFSSRLELSHPGRNKYFFWALPKGSYRIMSVSVPSTGNYIEPTPYVFDVPGVEKTYYLGDMKLDLRGEVSNSKLNRVEEIREIHVVDNYVEANDFLISRNPAYENRIEKFLIKKDDQNGAYDAKIINASESKYSSMKTSGQANVEWYWVVQILSIFLLPLWGANYMK
jgi:hypothetical protein